MGDRCPQACTPWAPDRNGSRRARASFGPRPAQAALMSPAGLTWMRKRVDRKSVV